MAPSLTYTELAPPRDLLAWVACFWRITGSATHGAAFQHRVLPDGCADLMFDLVSDSCIDLVGPMTVAQVVELTGVVDLLGVRLRPGAIAAFGGVRADELLNAMVPFSLGLSAHQLVEAADFPARLRLVIGALRARVAALAEPDPLVRHALGRWVRAESPDFPSVSVLTRDVGLSERAFERRFVANVGLTPVSYRRLARLRTVLRLHSQGARGWAAIAATTGFSDQAHLVRDCRAFTGLTPTEWAATQLSRAGFLQDGAVTTV
jgi:AraC-like DNA-binding protein